MNLCLLVKCCEENEKINRKQKQASTLRVVLKPDIFLGNCYLLECALNIASVERDVHELISRAQQDVQRDTLDDDKLYMHLVGSGKRVEVNEAFVGAKGIAVLHHLPIFRHFFHFHKNLSSSVLSGTFSRENRFPPKPKKRPKIAKPTKHEPLPKRDAISLKFP